MDRNHGFLEKTRQHLNKGWPYQRYDTFSGPNIFKVHDVKGSLCQKNIKMVKSGSGYNRLATIEGRKEGREA